MASGKGHARAAKSLIAMYIVTASVLIGMAVLSPLWAILLASGLVVGLYANPDVRDQPHVRNEGEHLVDKHFGVVAGFFWTLYWWPLAWMLQGKHRGWASHLPVVGTFIAWVWLFVPLWAIVAIVWTEYADIVFVCTLAVFPGWAVQDCVHLAQDGGLRRIRW